MFTIIGFVIGAITMAAIWLLVNAGDVYRIQHYRIDDLSTIKDLQDVEVLICLAGGRGRVTAAADIWLAVKNLRETKKLSRPVFYLSGTGADFQYADLKDAGVSETVWSQLQESDVLLESVSENTEENAALFRSFQRQASWKNGVLVTSSYHLRRASAIFKRALSGQMKLVLISSGIESFQEDEWRSNLNGLWVTITEYLKTQLQGFASTM
jgi:uncharacterized SAM-binding protein YcdF (DUF218 family)